MSRDGEYNIHYSSLLWKLLNDEIKNNETEYLLECIHFIDHFHVNIDSNNHCQRVPFQCTSNLPFNLL